MNSNHMVTSADKSQAESGNTRRNPQGNRWQAKRFHLTKTYRDGLGEMIRRRLSGRAQHIALCTLNRFISTPTIYANLENLARDCGVHRNTLPKYLREISKVGLFRFETPPYWRRKSGFATEIIFPTKKVENWLRDNGLLKTMHKNSAWSKQRKANNDGVSTPAKLQKTPPTMHKNSASFHKNEVGLGAASPALSFAAAPDGRGPRRQGAPLPTKEERKEVAAAEVKEERKEEIAAPQADQLGGERYGVWYPASLEPSWFGPETFPLGARIVHREEGEDGEQYYGKVVGFPAGNAKLTWVLVQWEADLETLYWESYRDLYQPPVANAATDHVIGRPATKPEISKVVGADKIEPAPASVHNIDRDGIVSSYSGPTQNMQHMQNMLPELPEAWRQWQSPEVSA